MFAGSGRGAERAALMYTLIQTAKLNDIDPHAWLAHVLSRIAETPQSRLGELLPWNWTIKSPLARCRLTAAPGGWLRVSRKFGTPSQSDGYLYMGICMPCRSTDRLGRGPIILHAERRPIILFLEGEKPSKRDYAYVEQCGGYARNTCNQHSTSAPLSFLFPL